MPVNDRRKETRIGVRFPCELAFGSQRAAGTVLDLSAGGLSVAADGRLDQGDIVFVRLHPKGRSSIDIETLVWNIRKIRSRGKPSKRLGLVLSEAPDEFLDLLRSKGQAPVADGARAAASADSCAPEPEVEDGTEAPAGERGFRVRVKQSASTRTRGILVFARSTEDAAEKALTEAGAGWSLVEVVAR